MFLFFLVANFWFWKIYSINILILILLLISTSLLYISTKKPKVQIIFILAFTILLFSQYKTTEILPLNYLSPLDINQIITRGNEYPAYILNLGKLHLNFPVAHNLEDRGIYVILSKLEHNLFDALDINSYFFSGHPREGSFVQHFPQIPFIFLPFFLIGIFKTNWYKEKSILISLLCPLFLLTIIGSENILGAFSLLPFFSIILSSGFEKLIFYYKNLKIL